MNLSYTPSPSSPPPPNGFKPIGIRVAEAIDRFVGLHKTQPRWLLLGYKSASQLGAELHRELGGHGVYLKDGDLYRELRVEVSKIRKHCVIVGLTMTATG